MRTLPPSPLSRVNQRNTFFVFVELLYAVAAAYLLVVALPISVGGLVFSIFGIIQ